MKKHLIFSLLFIFTFLLTQAQSPLSFSRKVIYMPEAFERPSESISVRDNSSKSSLPWIVFSDRADNNTTTVPGGSLMMKKLKFMEPFFVSKEENGYLKLIKYKAGMVRGRKINDKKSAISYGWIPKSRLLLWQRSYSNQKSGFPEKALTMINGKSPLQEPKYYFDSTDSVYVYSTPELKDKKSKVRLHEIIYVYKKSEDGKTYLIGSEDQLVVDTAAKSIYGWVSAQTVHGWGERLYISAKKPGNYDVDDSTANAINKGLAVSTGFEVDPLLPAKNIILRSVPVLTAEDGNSKVGLANNVFNKKDNKILTINGSYLSYEDYVSLRKNKNKINVVFVVDGGSPMAKYYAGITNTIQSFENVFNDFGGGRTISYGGVVYQGATGCTVSGVSSSPLKDDFRQLMQFLTLQNSKVSQCDGKPNDQPVFQGIQAGLDLFKEKKNETNLIILIGSTGNSDGANNLTIRELARQTGKNDARILALQVYSDFEQSFNNFVIQSRKLVSESAIQSAEFRKGTMVKGEGLKDFQPYNTSLQDSISYYLDYPKNSLIQGGVVFPTKGSVNTNSSMSSAMRRFLRETNMDIQNQISSLDSAFRLTGISRKNLNPVVEGMLTPPVEENVADRMPHNAFKYYAEANFSPEVVKSNSDKLQYVVVLNTMEYRQVIEIFSGMLGENLQQDQSSFRSKLVKNYVSMPRSLLGIKLSKSEIKSMTLADYLKLVTGLPLSNELLTKYTVANMRSNSLMPLEDFESYIRLLSSAVQNIKRAAQIDQQFISNGNPYYYITEGNFQNIQQAKTK
ncbi:type VI secretion system protein TssR domain-containing protein [Pedobacter lithocola]|uniref:Type VI secretion system protein TssR domain-containing protein n=1 Tax=Pedobacter lithocola TaxID=1908239 RepID=A0ABV8PE11_9SPHI